eukprot:TRINITY_DN332_c0_g3_i1.p1 TRINITY_DN332_c0_g3~~TRINITY_DN332_c0_g3_i1.p1  ORF type:complete len:850 (+),score=185.12 TRINITY_DN332_c0_g3_i1:228-2777(+)
MSSTSVIQGVFDVLAYSVLLYTLWKNSRSFVGRIMGGPPRKNQSLDDKIHGIEQSLHDVQSLLDQLAQDPPSLQEDDRNTLESLLEGFIVALKSPLPQITRVLDVCSPQSLTAEAATTATTTTTTIPTTKATTGPIATAVSNQDQANEDPLFKLDPRDSSPFQQRPPSSPSPSQLRKRSASSSPSRAPEQSTVQEQEATAAAADLLAALSAYDAPATTDDADRERGLSLGTANDVLASLSQYTVEQSPSSDATAAGAGLSPASSLRAMLAVPPSFDSDNDGGSNTSSPASSLRMLLKDGFNGKGNMSPSSALLASLRELGDDDNDDDDETDDSMSGSTDSESDLARRMRRGSDSPASSLRMLLEQPGTDRDVSPTSALLASLGQFDQQSDDSPQRQRTESVESTGSVDSPTSSLRGLLAGVVGEGSASGDVSPGSSLLASLNQLGGGEERIDESPTSSLRGLFALGDSSDASGDSLLASLEQFGEPSSADGITPVPETPPTDGGGHEDAAEYLARLVNERKSKKSSKGTRRGGRVKGGDLAALFAAAGAEPNVDEGDNNENVAPRNEHAVIAQCGLAEAMNKSGMRRAKKKPLGFGAAGRGKQVYQMEDTNYMSHPYDDDDRKGLFCVFDGHVGKKCSTAAKSIFPKVWKERLSADDPDCASADLEQTFTKAFLEVDRQLLKYEYEGCTATAVYIWETQDGSRYLQAANVGDSTAFLVRDGKAIFVSYDHRVTDPMEVERMRAGGVDIHEGQTRINGMAVCRALGDHFIKQNGLGMVGDPFVCPSYKLGKGDSMLILASDGIWDVISGQDAYNLIKPLGSAQLMAKRLLKFALDHPKCHDNVTVIIALL